jgi:hypothetical protein
MAARIAYADRSQLIVDRGLYVIVRFSAWAGKDPDALIYERVHDLKEDGIRNAISGRSDTISGS